MSSLGRMLNQNWNQPAALNFRGYPKNRWSQHMKYKTTWSVLSDVLEGKIPVQPKFPGEIIPTQAV